MKNNRNKIAVLFTVALFTLSGVGIAYAHWTDTLNVTAEVTTGNVCWEFSGVTIEDDDQPINPGGDYETNNPDLTCNPGFAHDSENGHFWELDKNVAWGEYELIEDNDGFKKTLEVTLHNVYPCNFNEIAFYVFNCGTVPIKVSHIVINDEVYDAGTPLITMDLSGNGVDDFEIKWNNNWGAQYEPGCSATWEFSFWTHVLNDQDFEDGTFSFTISLICCQWNEYPLLD